MVMSTAKGRRSRPSGPRRRKCGPNSDRRRRKQFLPAGKWRWFLRCARAAASLFAPRTSISITRCAPSPSATICSASEWQTSSSAAVNARCAADAGLDAGSARGSVGQDEQRVVGGSVAIDRDGVEGSRGDIAQRFLQKRRRDGRIGDYKSQRGGHVGMNHPRALGAAHQMHPLACHFEGSRRRFRTRVGGADGQREFREGTSRRPAVARNHRQGAQDFFQRQRYADNASGADE